jgi:preprotein translocase subunit SecF
MTATAVAAKKASFWHRLYHGETEFDFVGKRKWGFILSAVLIVLSLGSLATKGLNLGLDFEGGVAWTVPMSHGMTTADAESVLRANGIKVEDSKIQTVGQGTDQRLRIQVPPLSNEATVKVTQDLAAKAGVGVNDISAQAVSATWGKEITKKAIRALVVFLIAIAIYVSLRFEWRMAVAALIAVVHDVVISVGIYSIFGFQVTPPTVIAFLTILGYSLYDTIVVFDKVHENTRRLSSGRFTYGDVVNLSMNQVLMRSINTSLAALLPVLSLLVVGSWIMGAVALEDFALALFVGLFIGAYSSIFIATPILAMLKEREPKYRQLKERLGRTTGNLAELRTPGAAPAPVREPAMATVGADGTPGITTRPPETSGLTHPPRPRKKKRR